MSDPKIKRTDTLHHHQRYEEIRSTFNKIKIRLLFLLRSNLKVKPLLHDSPQSVNKHRRRRVNPQKVGSLLTNPEARRSPCCFGIRCFRASGTHELRPTFGSDCTLPLSGEQKAEGASKTATERSSACWCMNKT